MIRWPSLQDVAKKTSASLVRFPLAYASALFCFGLACWMIYHKPDKDPETLIRLLSVGMLGISFFTAVRFIGETRFSSRTALIPLYSGALAVLALLFVSYVPDAQIYAYRVAQFSVAFHLLVAFGAAFQGNGGFWQFNAQMFVRICTAVLYSWTLYLGLCFALWSIDKLLGVKIEHQTYAYLGAFMAYIYNTWFFLLGYADDLSVFEETAPYPNPLRIFAQFILMPLVVIYLIIFYLYVAKIGIQQTWPEGRLGYLICGVSLVGILTHLLLDPLRDDERHPAVKVYIDWYYRVLFPLAILLVMATSRRVDEYGLTEKRYFLYAIAAWIGWLSIYVGWMKRRQLKAIPFSLFLIAVITSVGPWSAYSVSKWDQTRRLKSVLEKIGALRDGQIQKVAEASKDDRYQISRSLDYLISMHGAPGIAPLFGNMKDKPSAHAIMREKLGLEYAERKYRHQGDVQSDYFYVNAKTSDGVSVSGYDGLYQIQYWNSSRRRETFELGGMKYGVSFSSAASALNLWRDEELLIELPVGEIMRAAKQHGIDHGLAPHAQYPLNVLALERENEKVRAKIQLTSLNGRTAGQADTVESISGYLLFKLK